MNYCAQLTVTGSGYNPVGNFEAAGTVIKPDADPQLMRLLRVIVLCNDAILHKSTQGWDILGDPTEGALLAVAAKAGLCRGELEEKQPRLDELPFESEQQFMATLHPEANQRMAYVKGSVEKVLTMCASFSTANDLWMMLRVRQLLKPTTRWRLRRCECWPLPWLGTRSS